MPPNDPEAKPSLRAALFSPRVAVMAALGFASGLPYAVATDTAQVMLAGMKVDVTALGWIGAVGAIYSFKFMWSPIVDATAVPGLDRLGRRRSWLVATQVALVVGLVMLALCVPRTAVAPLAGFAVVLVVFAMLSATQDIVVNAWTIDTFPPRELGFGSGISVWSYRAAVLAGSAAAPVIADLTSWPVAFGAMALLMLAGLVATLLAREPRLENPPPSFGDALVEPVRELLARLGTSFIVVLALVLLFRLPDQLANAPQKSLLLSTLEYTMKQYAIMRNGVGLGATLVGALIGGIVVARWGMLRAMLLGGALGALSNLGFAWMAIAVAPLHGTAHWASWPMLALVIVAVVENMSAGLVATVFVAFLMSLCDRRYAATQYAILSGAMAFTTGWASVLSGYLTKSMSWPAFFAVTALAGLPGLALVPLAVRSAHRSRDAEPDASAQR